MAISYQDFKSDRQWRSSTGLNQSQFEVLSEQFALAYEQIHGETILERKSGSTQESIFWTYEELLFFVLFSLKCGLAYDVLGLVFGCDGSKESKVDVARTSSCLIQCRCHACPFFCERKGL